MNTNLFNHKTHETHQNASQTSVGYAIGVPPLAGASETHAPSPSVCSAVVMPLRGAMVAYAEFSV